MMYEPTSGISVIIDVKDLDEENMIKFAKALIIEDQLRIGEEDVTKLPSNVIVFDGIGIDLRGLTSTRLVLWKTIAHCELATRIYNEEKTEIIEEWEKLSSKDRYKTVCADFHCDT